MRTRDRQLVVRDAGTPVMNTRELVMITVAGKVAHPTSSKHPQRIGPDGVPRILPGTGGVVVNCRVGDPAVGLAADHVEPGVSLRNDDRAVVGDKDAQNLALNTYACVGNRAVVTDGPCVGQVGTVCGKHGGVDHVMIDYPRRVLRRLRIGDPVQVYAYGLGLRFPEQPEVVAWNCSPSLVQRWGVRAHGARLLAPVTHVAPASVMGSGTGRGHSARGDFDIELSSPEIVRRCALGRLRFGDFIAIADADTRFGRGHRIGYTTVGVIVHSDSSVSGHGPGVVTLLSGPSNRLIAVRDGDANLAGALRLRALPRARPQKTLVQKDRARATRRVPARSRHATQS